MIDQGRKDIGRFGIIEPVAATDGLECFKCEPTHEHRQPPKQLLFDRTEQFVRPSQRRLQCALSVDTPTRVGEKRQPLAQACGDVGGTKRPAATRRQFDSERQTLEMAADLHNGVAVDIIEISAAKPIQEQFHGG